MAVSFYRSLGFRRIGTSHYLALSLDPDHKSHSLAITEDIKPPQDSAEPDLPDDNDSYDDWDGNERRNIKVLEHLKTTRPLEHAVATLPDAECLKFFESFTDHSEVTWTQVDRLENNLLHLLGCKLKLLSLKWVMDKFNQDDRLSSARNLEGYTPFEALQDQLETSRTQRVHGMMTIDVSDQFDGFSPEAVESLFLLSMPLLRGVQRSIIASV